MDRQKRAHHPKQKGYGLLLLVSVLSVLGIAAMVWMSTETLNESSRNLSKDKENYLLNLQTKIASWYLAKASEIERNSFSAEDLWKEIQETPKWGGRIYVSKSIQQGLVQGRKIILYLPNPGLTMDEQKITWNETDGSFSALKSQNIKVINGAEVQLELWRETEKRLKRLATLIENRARAKFELDPDRDQDYNHMRARTCNSIEEIECVDQWKAIDATNIPSLIGLAAHSIELKDAWGKTIEVENKSGMAVPPWYFSLRSVPPWGGRHSIEIKAVQPLE